jgi:formylglycine-generating enzyme required for sulfatase activity
VRDRPTKLTAGILFLILFILFILFGISCKKADDYGTPKRPKVITTKSGLEMVVIPGGWFEMGSNRGAPDESPVHRVWVSAFWIDRYEVVQEQFKKYQLPDPSHFKNSNDPLEQINWTDAAIYCNDRSRAEGLEPCYDQQTWDCNFAASGYRLPTEAEWEYACRAGTDSQYSFGNDTRDLKDHAWFVDDSSGKTHPVGQKKANPWGLYDMHGNVAEWCNDLYSKDYYAQSPQRDPRGPQNGKERVLRGGAWNSGAEACRSTYRASDPSIDDTCLASDAIGFRCVRRAPDSTSSEANMTNQNSAQNTTKIGLVYDDVYLDAFEKKLKPSALAFSPDFVFISAGFDAHENDLLGGMKVSTEGFAQLTRIVKGIAQKCREGRLVSVLEGGYHLGGLAASTEAHIRVLMR